MQRRLPPFASLKNFEAAARHLSFTKAASELCVTQAAKATKLKRLRNILAQRCLFATHANSN